MDTPAKLDTPTKKPWFPEHHPWRWRLAVGIVMFGLAFLGLIFTLVAKEKSWVYWRFLAVFYAIISLALSSYFKHRKWRDSFVTIWHEVFHWLALILSLEIVSNMVSLGFIIPVVAGLQALIMLALATFLAGIYIEKTFLFVGGLLGCFAYVTLYSYMLFILLAAVIIIGFYFYVRHKSHQMTDKESQ